MEPKSAKCNIGKRSVPAAGVSVCARGAVFVAYIISASGEGLVRSSAPRGRFGPQKCLLTRGSPSSWCQTDHVSRAVYLQLLLRFDAPAPALLKPHNAHRACFQSEDMRDEFRKSSAALLVPYSPPSPDPVPLCPGVSIRLEAGNVGIPNKGLHH